MLNFDSLLTAVTKTNSYIRMVDYARKESPVIGFIQTAPMYLKEEVFVPEAGMENAYKSILPILRDLIDQIPEGFEGIDPIAQTHIVKGVAVVKAHSIDGFPYTILAAPYEQQGKRIIVKLTIVVAYAKIELASDKFLEVPGPDSALEDLPNLPEEDSEIPEPEPIKKPRKKRATKSKTK